MKVGLKTIFFVGDAGGFADAVSGALHPLPHSSVHKLEDSFELPLDSYEIRDQKAVGRLIHFVDDGGIYQVSILHLKSYEVPVLACVLSEVLQLIRSEQSSVDSTLLFPFLVPSSKLKRDTKTMKLEGKGSSLYGVLLGPETNVSQALAVKTQKPPPLLQINHEALACVLHIVRVLGLPAFLLIGKEGQEQNIELTNEIGELLAGESCLSFSKDKLVWSSASISKELEEPWRALYG